MCLYNIYKDLFICFGGFFADFIIFDRKNIGAYSAILPIKATDPTKSIGSIGTTGLHQAMHLGRFRFSAPMTDQKNRTDNTGVSRALQKGSLLQCEVARSTNNEHGL